MLTLVSHFLKSDKEHLSKRKIDKILHSVQLLDKRSWKNPEMETRNFTQILKKANPNKLQKSVKEIRFLVEFKTPVVRLDYLHHVVAKKLSAIDLNHLILTQFR